MSQYVRGLVGLSLTAQMVFGGLIAAVPISFALHVMSGGDGPKFPGGCDIEFVRSTLEAERKEKDRKAQRRQFIITQYLAPATPFFLLNNKCSSKKNS